MEWVLINDFERHGWGNRLEITYLVILHVELRQRVH